MSDSYVKSTIAIDPVKAALTKAELYAVKGERDKAIECLQEALAEKPDNVELKDKLEKVKAMPSSDIEIGSGSGIGKVVLVVAVLIVAMFILYAFIL